MPATIQIPIHASTRYCAVYGHPVRHSASPAMHNAGLAALGLDWAYLAFDVSPPQLAEAIAGAQAMRFLGLNLTVPHKLMAVRLVDALDVSAQTWGAVNTIRFETQDADGAWQPLGQVPPEAVRTIRAQGFNTDADALTRSLGEDLGLEVRGASIVVLGAGGAGRTAALKLADDGAGHLYLINRTLAKAEAVAREIRDRFPRVKVDVHYPSRTVDLLLNATSLGLKPEDALPWDAQAYPLRRSRAVYDMIYRPAETPLLEQARAAGCRVANGLGMLLYQGTKALELWTGQDAPVDVMRQALMHNVYGGPSGD